jgi:uncharacterized oligopeptide transporter (OPT) family protein
MPHHGTVIIVIRALLLLVSAFYAIGCILALRAGRKGWRGVLAWALFIPLDIAWKQLSPGLPMSDQWHRVSHDFRLICSGAWVMYGIMYVVPFLGRDRREQKAARKRAAAASRGGQTP